MIIDPAVSPVSNVGDLQVLLAQKLGIAVADLTGFEMNIGPMRKELIDKPKLSFNDLNIHENAVITLVVRTPVIIQSLEAREQQIQAFNILKKKKLMTAAQDGLKGALEAAIMVGAHVIITVGSYLNINHAKDPDSLRRQQFPIDKLGAIDGSDRVHLIHIDFGFKNPKREDVLQYHESDDWEHVGFDQNRIVATYQKGQYRITTVAHDLEDQAEVNAYFKDGGEATFSLLGVDVSPYMRQASDAGTGFVAGNFYSSIADPVLLIEPVLEPEKENVSGSANQF